jgi:small nuclear ribonucleoprotein (snRNP)-like protein
MAYKIDRPLDLLDECKRQKIEVLLKDGQEIVGNLLAFDLYINLVLENAEMVSNIDDTLSKKEILFIKGDNIVSVEPKK